MAHDSESWPVRPPCPSPGNTFYPDPFGVRAATAQVMQETPWVTIANDAIQRCAETLQRDWDDPPAWDDALHYRGSPVDTAGWVVVLDALNFCFWAQGDDPQDRWRVTWRGTTHNGYNALAAALHRAVVEDRHPIWDPAWLRSLTLESAGHLLRGDDDCPPIPLLERRIDNLHELGTMLGDRHPGALARQAGGSAVRLVRSVLGVVPSFRDVATWQTPSGDVLSVPFHKRAQILAADLAGALAGTDLAITNDLDSLTAFADYKVPQVLRRLGILRYQPDLAERIHRFERITANGAEEVSIRAGTIVACDRLVTALAGLGTVTTASELDWRLWTFGQDLAGEAEPYHRTLTTSY